MQERREAAVIQEQRHRDARRDRRRVHLPPTVEARSPLHGVLLCQRNEHCTWKPVASPSNIASRLVFSRSTRSNRSSSSSRSTNRETAACERAYPLMYSVYGGSFFVADDALDDPDAFRCTRTTVPPVFGGPSRNVSSTTSSPSVLETSPRS